jgi:hypothetical protein
VVVEGTKKFCTVVVGAPAVLVVAGDDEVGPTDVRSPASLGPQLTRPMPRAAPDTSITATEVTLRTSTSGRGKQ